MQICICIRELWISITVSWISIISYGYISIITWIIFLWLSTRHRPDAFFGYHPAVIHKALTKATFTHARGGCAAEAGGFWHSRSATAGMFTHTRSGRGRICHFFDNIDGLEGAVSKRTGKIGCWTNLLRSGFCSRSASAPRRVCVNACNDLCWTTVVSFSNCNFIFKRCSPYIYIYIYIYLCVCV